MSGTLFVSGALLLFGSMVVWVTIGGFYDIKRLFARIAESHRQEAEETPPDT